MDDFYLFELIVGKMFDALDYLWLNYYKEKPVTKYIELGRLYTIYEEDNDDDFILV
tara:strand:+ start:1223 stop:1390 length:168 start_codon:yes stop_codon:yes gene_type:complete